MRTMMVIGGEGRLSGLMADRVKDDMLSLLKGLKDISQYKQLLILPTPRFLTPPDNLDELIPLGDFDEQLLQTAMQSPEAARSKILRVCTAQALALFYEAMLSFATGRQIVLIPAETDLCQGLLPFFSFASEEGLETQRVEKDPLPLLGGIQNWPLLFPRFDQPHTDCTVLVPREPATLVFPWETEVPAKTVLRRLGQILHQPLDAQYPAVDTLNHPRSLLLKGNREGFLLAIPPPSNLKNLSITLQTGKGITVASAPASSPAKTAAPELTRDWLTRSEVAAEIGKSTDTVDNYCRDGVLEFSKVGREVRITKESVQRYLDGRG